MPLDIYAYHNSNDDFLFVTPFISRMHISRIEYIRKELKEINKCLPFKEDQIT